MKKKPQTKTPKATGAICPDCKNPEHEPGMSEFSNCGESDISHSRYDDILDNFDTEIY